MRIQIYVPILCLLAIGYTSCKEASKPAPPLAIGHGVFKKSAGRDCAKMDSVHNHCATINLRWPDLTNANEPLKSRVSEWSESFLAELMSGATYDSIAAHTVPDAAMAFLAAHAAWSKEAQDSPLGEWTAESGDSVLLNDGKLITLAINAYVFTGGAHGSPVSCIGTFDAVSGKQLGWVDMVTDTAALKALAEKKFREVRAEDFKPSADGTPGFNFDANLPFELPGSYGLTDKGIYFHYDPSEIAPYAMGPTAFVISFEELGKLKK